MARSTTIRLPGMDGPDITIERGVFSPPRVSIDGQTVARDPKLKNTYSIALPDGTTRSIMLKSDWRGTVVVAEDGSRLPLDPPRPIWETVLTFAPFALVAIGGLVGGAFGGGGVAANMAISRSGLRPAVRAAAMVAVLAVATVSSFFVARGVATILSPLPTYTAGQCVDGIGTGDTIDASAIRVIDCADSHDGEIVGVHLVNTPSPSAAYPGLSAIDVTAATECRPLFAGYVGTDFDKSRLEMIFLYPSGDTWDRGDREIACVAFGPGGEQLTGSVAGTAR